MVDDSSWIDELPDGLVVCGPDGTIVMIIHRLCAIAGYDRDELIGKLVDHLGEFVEEIDLVIREIRTAVFMLGSAAREGSLGQELAIVVSQARRILGFTPRLRFEAAVETAMGPDGRTELLASLGERSRTSAGMRPPPRSRSR